MPNRCEWHISPQHWAQNATSDNAYDTTLDGTRCVAHHNCATLIFVDGRFVCTVPLDKLNIFTLQTAPGYTCFTEYVSAVGYDPF